MRPKITMEIGQDTYDELLTLSETIGYPPEAALSYAVRLGNACIREGLLTDVAAGSAHGSGQGDRVSRREKNRIKPRLSAQTAWRKGVDVMDRFSLLLVIIGAINWGLVGLFQFDLIAFLFGGQAALVSRVLYTIVGAAGLWSISMLFSPRETTHTTSAHADGARSAENGKIVLPPMRGRIFLSSKQKLGHVRPKMLN